MDSMMFQGRQLFATEEDGRQVVVPSPSTEGWDVWFTGAADLRGPTIRGAGAEFLVTYTNTFLNGTWTWGGTTTVLATDTSQVAVGDWIQRDKNGTPFKITAVTPNVSVTIANPPENLDDIPSGTGKTIKLGVGSKTTEWRFAEPVEVHDGQGVMTGSWDANDTGTVSLRLPATVVTPNGSGTGNCTLVDTGQGYNAIIPAFGAGDYDVDLTEATPIPASGGYWNADRDTGVITAIDPGNMGAPDGGFNLIDAEPPIAFFINRVSLGQKTGVFDVDVYKVKWVHQNWVFQLTTSKTTPGKGMCALWLLCFRKITTQV